MKISDAQVTRALQTFYRDFSSTDFDQDVEDAMRAVLEDALAAVPEPEYEYGWAGDEQATTFYATKEEAEEYMGNPKRFVRAKAGPWEEVEEA